MKDEQPKNLIKNILTDYQITVADNGTLFATGETGVPVYRDLPDSFGTGDEALLYKFFVHALSGGIRIRPLGDDRITAVLTDIGTVEIDNDHYFVSEDGYCEIVYCGLGRWRVAIENGSWSVDSNVPPE